MNAIVLRLHSGHPVSVFQNNKQYKTCQKNKFSSILVYSKYVRHNSFNQPKLQEKKNQ